MSTICQGFVDFSGVLHHFVLANLASSSIRVNHISRCIYLQSNFLHPQNPKRLFVRLKGKMHHHDDLGSKCAYACHLLNKTTRKSVLLSTPQIWLMKVSKKLACVWVWRLTLSEVVLMK